MVATTDVAQAIVASTAQVPSHPRLATVSLPAVTPAAAEAGISMESMSIAADGPANISEVHSSTPRAASAQPSRRIHGDVRR